jgi:hypothetical protein
VVVVVFVIFFINFIAFFFGGGCYFGICIPFDGIFGEYVGKETLQRRQQDKQKERKKKKKKKRINEIE